MTAKSLEVGKDSFFVTVCLSYSTAAIGKADITGTNAYSGVPPLGNCADHMWIPTMSISRFKAALLALVVQMLCVSLASGIELGVENYPNVHPPVPQQPSGPPQPAHDRPGPGPTVGDEPPSGIDASGPEFVNIADMEVFAPADISTYGAGIAPNTGWWGSWDYLRYADRTPHRTLIGNPDIATGYNTGTPVFYGATPNTSSDGTTGGSIAGPQLAPMDTGFIGDGPSNGYRWEGGWMDKNHGFMFSAVQAL